MRQFFNLLNQALDNPENFPSYFVGASLFFDLEKLGGERNVAIPSHGRKCWTFGSKKPGRIFNLDAQQMAKLRVIQARYGRAQNEV